MTNESIDATLDEDREDARNGEKEDDDEMPGAGLPVPDALLVQLVVSDDPHDTEVKYTQRCFETRTLLRELFLIHAGRDFRNAGPLAPNVPSMVIPDPEDQAIVVGWGDRYKRVIHSHAPVDGSVSIAEEFKPKEKKKKKKTKDVAGVALALNDDDDEIGAAKTPSALFSEDDD